MPVPQVPVGQVMALAVMALVGPPGQVVLVVVPRLWLHLLRRVLLLELVALLATARIQLVAVGAALAPALGVLLVLVAALVVRALMAVAAVAVAIPVITSQAMAVAVALTAPAQVSPPITGPMVTCEVTP